ncbi:MAG: MBL fold metallo-hydrolase [Rhodothermales bacterium]
MLTLACLALVPTTAAQNFDDVEIQVQEVADGIYMLLGRGGNIGVSAGEDGVFLIDDQYAPLTEKIKAAVATVADGPIRFLLNTHWHGDHTGGNENFGEAGTLIVAHDNVRVRMSTEQINELWDRTTPPSPEGAWPVVTFNEAVTFHMNGEEISAFHVAHAHTDGDAIVYFRNANVVHMGDTYFQAGYPFIDVDSGGSVDGLIAGVDIVLGMINEDTRVIPGHGELSNADGLRAYRDMLATIRGRIAEHIEAGRSLEEIQAAKPSAEYDADWGEFFIIPEQIVQIIYTSLTR